MAHYHKEQEDLYAEHRLVVHSDGSPCGDGCNAVPRVCRCVSRLHTYYKLGWIVCASCDRIIR